MAGCGLIGVRRGRVAQAHPSSEVVAVTDVDPERGRSLADELGCDWEPDWAAALSRRPDVCIVATPHKYLAELTTMALRAGTHVLCEKPLGRTPDEARVAIRASEESGYLLKTGFNLRHHEGIARAHALAVEGRIGPLTYARCRYGHGGRPGYDREWRSDPDISGGGELIDQGVHVLDLFRWFLGEFMEIKAFTATTHWDFAPLEDNVFALMRTAAGHIALMHASATQWRNLFSLEVFGRDGYIVVEGLGGSYGPERLRIGLRNPAGGVPHEEDVPLRGDDPWRAEWDEFLAAIRERRQPLANGDDGLRALTLAHEIYRAARDGVRVRRSGS